MCTEAQVVQAGSFCPNKECPDFGKVDAGVVTDTESYGFARPILSGSERLGCEKDTGQISRAGAAL